MNKYTYFIILIFLLLFAEINSTYSIPQFSLLTGNKCISCHIMSQGGGLRNDLSAYTHNDVSLLKPKTVGLEWLYKLDPQQNTIFDGKLTLGMDFRLQMARSHKSEDAQRKIFPMQAAVYAQYAPVEWMSAEAAINVGHKRFGNTNTADYPGQQPWMASVAFQPSLSWPSLRIGKIQPSIGIRYDDHTKLTRQAPSADGTNTTGISSIIPPLYGEYGTEATYDGLHIITLSAGIFGSQALSEVLAPVPQGSAVSLISAKNKPSFAFRAMFWPRFFNNSINTLAGGSYFVNDDFFMLNGFAGIGLTDYFSLTFDYAHSNKKSVRTTNTYSLEGLYQINDALLLCARIETGNSIIGLFDEFTNQIVLGVQAFILPYIELRPEYRIMEANDFRSGRWAAQLHIFY